MQQYAIRTRPCIDKIVAGKPAFVTNDMILNTANALVDQKLSQSVSHTEKQSMVFNEYEKVKAAFVVSSIWNAHDYPTLKIGFMDGTDQQKQWVQQVVNTHLQPLIPRIKLVWGAPLRDAQIRISFREKGQAWSCIGSQALDVPLAEPTMNLGWLDDDTDFDATQYKGTGQVVLHEFGHAMGMIHEHQNPNGNPIVWNKPVVYSELQRTNGWSKDMVDNNMFKKYGDWVLCNQAKKMPITDNDGGARRVAIQNYCNGELVNGSTYDNTSIMHYWFPASWILEGNPAIPTNLTYSQLDQQWLLKYYGVGSTGSPPMTTPPTALNPISQFYHLNQMSLEQPFYFYRHLW